MNFKAPSPEEIFRAIGKTESLPVNLQRALESDEDFPPIPTPKPGDWLAVHVEVGQTFDQFLDQKPRKPDEIQTHIYLQPLGQFVNGNNPSLEMLRAYAAAYFVMEVKVLPPIAISGAKIATRINQFSGQRQLLTGDVLGLIKSSFPADAFCVLAITMEDLYPDPSWNFVFGQASLQQHVGVFSFARYDPLFYGEKRGDNYLAVLQRRSCIVLVHEVSHMFSLLHCIFFSCVMNGSNHLQESDARPLYLCPVCLRKLQHSIGFDVLDRYRRLLQFYRRFEFDDEAGWVSNRIKKILLK